MKSMQMLALAGVSLLSLATPALAQAQAAPSGQEGALADDIIVSARRRDESIQDVPLTVNAVSAEQIEKLNLRSFNDLTAVVPGLVLAPGNRTTGAVSSLRGINVDVNSSGSNTSVQFYLNDSVIPAGAIMQAMYDIGQVEVLRGPQGTLRGLASPSGSITVTTKKPDMNEFGGYVQSTVNTIDGVNLNGALNVPVIPGFLAIRLGALGDDNDSNRVRSIGAPGMKPYSKTRAYRASLRLTPFDNFELDASYNHVRRVFHTFDQIELAALADPTLALVGAPATSTPIRARDRLAVENVPNDGRQSFQILNWQAQWSFAGQRLTYVGSDVQQSHKSTEPYDKGDYFGATVPGNPAASNNNQTYRTRAATLNAQNAAQATHTYVDQQTHELRLSSEERLFGIFDYVAGLFVTKQVPWTDLVRVDAVVTLTSPPTIVTGLTNRRGRTIERAAFGNLTAHLGESTEISGGIRFINYKENTNNSSLALPQGPSNTTKATVWTASAKHEFGEDLMIYASAGSSFRLGSGTNGLILGSTGAPVVSVANARDPYLLSLFPNSPERSKSYEVGLRSTWLDNTLKFNISAFYQEFDGYILPSSPFYILHNPTSAAVVPNDPASILANVIQTRSTLATPVPAKVKGVEAEISYRPSDHLNLGATFAYAKSKISNGQLPCQFVNLAQARAYYASAPANTQVCLQSSNASAGRLAPFTASFQGEYLQPITDDVGGFVRSLVQVYGKSTNDAGNPFDDVSAYARANLYVGVRGEDGGWEVAAYAKNLFNNFRVISRDAAAQAVRTQVGFVSSNYRLVTVTEPREFGLTARVAFGSR